MVTLTLLGGGVDKGDKRRRIAAATEENMMICRFWEVGVKTGKHLDSFIQTPFGMEHLSILFKNKQRGGHTTGTGSWEIPLHQF